MSYVNWGWTSPQEKLFRKNLDWCEITSMETAKMEEKEEFLTREETAKLCRVKSLTTLWYWCKKGILVPALRSGRKPLYRKSDVINYLEGKEVDND
ncbi:helix-turn-helix domain-containing protein [Joostella sp.]|uniref:helix-turn-helix domain-containing protein n=1 Tax=Joostella sp. TaxID=2231138 RepID=UPI003A93761F